MVFSNVRLARVGLASVGLSSVKCWIDEGGTVKCVVIKGGISKCKAELARVGLIRSVEFQVIEI